MHNHSLRRYGIKTILLFSIALLIKLFSLSPTLVEEYYSTGIYIYLSKLLRILTGWLPFSVGDVLYAAAVIWIIIKTVRLIKALISQNITKKSLGRGILKTINVLLLVYIFFYLVWGLNYDRQGIASQLQLQPKQELARPNALTDSLLKKVNRTRLNLGAWYNTSLTKLFWRKYCSISKYSSSNTLFCNTALAALSLLYTVHWAITWASPDITTLLAARRRCV